MPTRGKERGEREIDPRHAAIEQRIFRAFADGGSPKAIARALNAEAVHQITYDADAAAVLFCTPRPFPSGSTVMKGNAGYIACKP